MTLADISALENLQNQANRSMGFSSQMSVFNATFIVEDKKKAEANKQKIDMWKQDFDRNEKFLIQTKDDIKKKKELFEKLEKEGQTVGQPFLKARNEFGVLRSMRAVHRNQLVHGIEKLKKVGIIATSTELDGD
jgi:Fe-S cluster assembly scaffold protein SufB